MVVMRDSFIGKCSYVPDYSTYKTFDGLHFCRGYFLSVKRTLESASHAIFLQHYRIWLSNPIVLMSGIRILNAGCVLLLVIVTIFV
jgi:hypothetical protein